MALSRFGITLCVFVIINLTVLVLIGPSSQPLNPQIFNSDNWSKPMYGSWTWWMARGYFSEPSPPDVVLLGSSQVTAAIWAAEAKGLNIPVDCLLHPRAVVLEKAICKKLRLKNLSVINCALGGAVASDYYVISKALFSESRKPKLVIVGISPRDFIDNQLMAASATEPFRFFSQFVDTGQLSSIAFPNLIDRLNAELDWKFSKVPTRRLHELLESELASKEAPIQCGNKGHQLLGAISNAALKVKPGIWVVSPHMADIFYDNTNEYIRRFKNPAPPIYPIEIAFFSQFLKRMKQMNVKVLAVGMPTQARNRSLLPPQFWQQYRGIIQSICTKYGATWCNISDSSEFKPNDYLDTVHMNARGGEKLIALVSAYIAKEETLANSLFQNNRPAGTSFKLCGTEAFH